MHTALLIRAPHASPPRHVPPALPPLLAPLDSRAVYVVLPAAALFDRQVERRVGAHEGCQVLGLAPRPARVQRLELRAHGGIGGVGRRLRVHGRHAAEQVAKAGAGDGALQTNEEHLDGRVLRLHPRIELGLERRRVQRPQRWYRRHGGVLFCHRCLLGPLLALLLRRLRLRLRLRLREMRRRLRTEVAGE
eukprot:359155-Chlamydomonas_euryale.AAC.12